MPATLVRPLATSVQYVSASTLCGTRLNRMFSSVTYFACSAESFTIVDSPAYRFLARMKDVQNIK